MRKRKYELTDRLEKKTWEIQQDGLSLTTKFAARKGTPPRAVDHELTSEAEANDRFDKLVAEREEQGYTLVDSEDAIARSPAQDAEALSFEAAITKAPDVADAYQVYGDWLSTQGDPLGELVAVQTRLTDKPRDGTLLAKQRELLDRHSSAWLGLLAGEEGFDAEWRWGFIEVVELGVDEPCSVDPVDALRALFRLPTARFLRELTLGDFGEEGSGELDLEEAVKALAKSPPPPTLRRLVFEAKRAKLATIELGDISPMLAKLPQLEDLAIKAGVITLGKIDLPELTSFKLMTRATKAVVKQVATARWPKLTSLVLGFGKTAGGATAADLRPILEGTGLPALTNLGLRGLPFADAVVAMLPSAKILPRLHSLDLSKGRLSNGDAQALVDMKKALAHVEDIDLSGNVLSKGAVAALTKAFGDRVTLDEGVEDDQTAGDDEDGEDGEDGEEHYDEITE
jgi:uncharacterized protein (TIGR02996 family)